MTRRAVAVDRILVALFGLALTALGAAALWWTYGPRAGDPLPLTPVSDAVDEAWWPWAAGAAGVVLVVLALCWLAAHHPPARAKTVGIGSGFTAEVRSVADAAGVALRAQPGVLSAGARAVVERGVPTITLSVTVAARHGLSAAVAAADEVAGTIGAMLGDVVAVRTRVHVDGRRRHGTVR